MTHWCSYNFYTGDPNVCMGASRKSSTRTWQLMQCISSCQISGNRQPRWFPPRKKFLDGKISQNITTWCQPTDVQQQPVLENPLQQDKYESCWKRLNFLTMSVKETCWRLLNFLTLSVKASATANNLTSWTECWISWESTSPTSSSSTCFCNNCLLRYLANIGITEYHALAEEANKFFLVDQQHRAAMLFPAQASSPLPGDTTFTAVAQAPQLQQEPSLLPCKLWT